jgi:hypothetical protein
LRRDTIVFGPKVWSRRLTSSSLSPLATETPKCASTSSAGSACGASGGLCDALTVVMPISRAPRTIRRIRAKILKCLGKNLTQVNATDRRHGDHILAIDTLINGGGRTT